MKGSLICLAPAEYGWYYEVEAKKDFDMQVRLVVSLWGIGMEAIMDLIAEGGYE